VHPKVLQLGQLFPKVLLGTFLGLKPILGVD
jgi:hypothetical protein